MADTYSMLLQMGIPVRVGGKAPAGVESAAVSAGDPSVANATTAMAQLAVQPDQGGHIVHQVATAPTQRQQPLPPPPPPTAQQPWRPTGTTVDSQRRQYPPQSYLDGPLSDEMVRLLQTHLQPTEQEQRLLQQSLDQLQQIVAHLFGGHAVLHAFGSTACGMSLKGSADIDLCLEGTAVMLQAITAEVASLNADIERENEVTTRQRAELKAAKAKRLATKEKEAKDGTMKKELVNETANETAKSTVKEEDKEEEVWPTLKQLYTPSRLVLERLGKALEGDVDRYEDVKVLTNTRVPIIKCTDRRTRAKIDIGFDNKLAVSNTRMLFLYSLLDSRFKVLAMVIKHWAKRRSINSTYEGTLSSYAYVLMLLHYLQNVCQPPVLPNLQQLPPPDLLTHPTLAGYLMSRPPQVVQQMMSRERWMDDNVMATGESTTPVRHNTYFLEDAQLLSLCWSAQNTQSLGSLFFGFIHYWAFDFDFKSEVASVRLGRCLTKTEKGWVPLLDSNKKSNNNDADKDGAEADSKATDEVTDNVKPVIGEQTTTDIDNENENEGETDSPTADETNASSTAPAKQPKPRLQRFWLCIEDPFEVTHNLGRPVGRDSLYFIRGEFLKAHSILTSARNFSRAYMASLSPDTTHNNNGLSGSPPRLLQEICAETKFKTREEHKSRNKANMALSTGRRRSSNQNNEPAVTLSAFIEEPKQAANSNSLARGGRQRVKKNVQPQQKQQR